MEKKKRAGRAAAAAETLPETGREPVYTDVDGSYTGCPADGEKPVQDADDL